MATLGEVLDQLMRRAGVGAQTLSKLTGVPRTAIDNWREGRVRRPRHWRPLTGIARVLSLSRADVDRLLDAAGFPPVLNLAADLPSDHPDREYLNPWVSTVQVAGAPTRHQARAPAADFVGREDVIDHLVRALQDAAGRGGGAVVVVQGMAGVGKTELAIVVANRLCDGFPDAQLVLNLRGMSNEPLSTATAMQQVVHAFVPDAPVPDHLDALRQRYCATLHGKGVLVVADDARDAAHVRDLMPPAGCALLVTSRQQFTLPGMTSVALEPLPPADATTLLQSITDRITDEEACEIAELGGHLPLALRAMGGILRNDSALSVADYLGRLADERQRLATLSDPDDADVDVAASLALSYALLPVPVQGVFRQLGVLVADFDTALARAMVTGPTGVDVEQTLHLLLRRNLLMFDPWARRWRLHDLVRALARREMETAGDDLNAVRSRYATASVDRCMDIHERFVTGEVSMYDSMTRFDADRAHIDHARRWASDHAGDPEADRLLVRDGCLTTAIADARYHPVRDRIPHLRRAVAAALRSGDRSGEARVLNYLGIALRLTGDARAAAEVFSRALPKAREIGDRATEVGLLTNLGNMRRLLGDIRGAIEHLSLAIGIAPELGQYRPLGIALNILGVAHWELGEHDSAAGYYEQWLALARDNADRDGELMALTNLGLAHADSGQPTRALECHKAALHLALSLNDRRAVGIIVNNMGQAYVDLGEVVNATWSAQQGIDIAREMGDRHSEADALMTLGRARAAAGERERAWDLFEQALELLDEMGYRTGGARCRWYFGTALAEADDIARASALLSAANEAERAMGHAKAAEHAATLAALTRTAIGA
jgi:tetratricopeptide (TPR) repeat protein